MNIIELKNASCVDQEVDAVVNAANKGLLPGTGVCGEIFERAGYKELYRICQNNNLPLNDGDAVITPALNITNAKYIIHAVGPDFGRTPNAFDKLFMAYYNSLIVLKNNELHSIAFPLISSGVYSGNLENPVSETTKQCIAAYLKFIQENKDYEIKVFLCAFTDKEMIEAEKAFEESFT